MLVFNQNDESLKVLNDTFLELFLYLIRKNKKNYNEYYVSNNEFSQNRI